MLRSLEFEFGRPECGVFEFGVFGIWMNHCARAGGGQGYTPGYTGHVPQDKYRFGNSPYTESEHLQPPSTVPHHWG